MTSNFSPSLIDEYQAQFTNPTAGPSPFVKLSASTERGFMHDLEMLDLDSVAALRSRPAMQWLRRNFNLLRGASSRLNLERAWTDILMVMYAEERGGITEAEQRVGELFLEHFAKALELSRAFGVLRSRFSGVLTALDRFHVGVFILAPSGAVVIRNAEAERIVDARDGISISRDGHLRPSDESLRGELKAAIERAVHTSQAGDNCAETVFDLPRRSGEASYFVEVSPVREDGEIEKQFRGALVFIVDPAKTDVVSTRGMQSLYGLTDTESEVCRLVAEGLGTEEVAEARNVTRETVRNYIKQVLRKTGVQNRAQLVRLALKVNLPIDPESGGL
ncbi:MAG: helix-turn-helix transcriptional regulator, partial [Rhodospirillales bacterium]|nr:helix-turn-helix transcriptional regulator [Rhodospirillales bacterium]